MSDGQFPHEKDIYSSDLLQSHSKYRIHVEFNEANSSSER